MQRIAHKNVCLISFLLDSVYPSFPGKISNATKSKGAAEMIPRRVALWNGQADSACTRCGYDRCETNKLILVDVKAHRGVADKGKNNRCVMGSRGVCIEWKKWKGSGLMPRLHLKSYFIMTGLPLVL